MSGRVIAFVKDACTVPAEFIFTTNVDEGRRTLASGINCDDCTGAYVRRNLNYGVPEREEVCVVGTRGGEERGDEKRGEKKGREAKRKKRSAKRCKEAAVIYRLGPVSKASEPRVHSLLLSTAAERRHKGSKRSPVHGRSLLFLVIIRSMLHAGKSQQVHHEITFSPGASDASLNAPLARFARFFFFGSVDGERGSRGGLLEEVYFRLMRIICNERCMGDAANVNDAEDESGWIGRGKLRNVEQEHSKEFYQGWSKELTASKTSSTFHHSNEDKARKLPSVRVTGKILRPRPRGRMQIPLKNSQLPLNEDSQPHRRRVSFPRHGRKNPRDRRIELVVRSGIIHGSGLRRSTKGPGPKGPALPRCVPMLVNSRTFPRNESPAPPCAGTKQ